jgi:hypothetical protein
LKAGGSAHASKPPNTIVAPVLPGLPKKLARIQPDTPVALRGGARAGNSST